MNRLEETVYGPEQREQESDSQRLARCAREVLRAYGVDVNDPDVVDGLAGIAEADPEMAIVLIMDLMGNSGLDPDEAFAKVLELDAGKSVEKVLPNVSERLAVICGMIFDGAHIEVPDAQLRHIALMAPRAAMGVVCSLLVERGVYQSTQEAERFVDPDGSLATEIESRGF